MNDIHFQPMKELSLQGRNIIVTGAGQGIGKALSIAIVRLGGNVIAVDTNAEGLKALSDEIGADRCVTVTGSVAQPETAQQAIDAGVAQFGQVNGLVNNAGIVRPAMIEKMSVEDWQQVLDVHLSGSFYFIQAIGRHLLPKAKAGEAITASIVNISSEAGRCGTIGQVNYGVAKTGVMGLTMCAAREWTKYGIRINTVSFGMVETPMTEVIRSEKFRDTYLAKIPMGRWSQPEEVARPVCFLLSEAASYITGQHLSVNGGGAISL